MDRLIAGYRRFRAETWPREKARFEELEAHLERVLGLLRALFVGEAVAQGQQHAEEGGGERLRAGVAGGDPDSVAKLLDAAVGRDIANPPTYSGCPDELCNLRTGGAS